MSKLILLFLLLWPVAALSQSLTTVAPQQCVWRAGDDPAWAAAGLDESGWQPYTQSHSFSDQAHLWFRCHADLSSLRGTVHPAIQVTLQAAFGFERAAEISGRRPEEVTQAAVEFGQQDDVTALSVARGTEGQRGGKCGHDGGGGGFLRRSEGHSKSKSMM
jgi:hypothetical protein